MVFRVYSGKNVNINGHTGYLGSFTTTVSILSISKKKLSIERRFNILE